MLHFIGIHYSLAIASANVRHTSQLLLVKENRYTHIREYLDEIFIISCQFDVTLGLNVIQKKLKKDTRIFYTIFK